MQWTIPAGGCKLPYVIKRRGFSLSQQFISQFDLQDNYRFKYLLSLVERKCKTVKQWHQNTFDDVSTIESKEIADRDMSLPTFFVEDQESVKADIKLLSSHSPITWACNDQILFSHRTLRTSLPNLMLICSTRCCSCYAITRLDVVQA